MDYYTATGTSRGFREESMDDEQGSFIYEVGSEVHTQTNELGKQQIPPGNTS